MDKQIRKSEESKLDKVYNFALKHCVNEFMYIIFMRNKLKEDRNIIIYKQNEKEILQLDDNKSIFFRIAKEKYSYINIYVKDPKNNKKYLTLTRNNDICVYMSEPFCDSNDEDIYSVEIEITFSTFINYSRVFTESISDAINFVSVRYTKILNTIYEEIKEIHISKFDIRKLFKDYSHLWDKDALEQLSIEDCIIVGRFMSDRIFNLRFEIYYDKSTINRQVDNK